MKKLMKRWLAMLLAVLMVMGTLPTTAFAARVDSEEKSETPVLEQGDGVADTMKVDDGETPIEPVDPDPEPVDPSRADWTIAVEEFDESTGYYKLTVYANGQATNDTSGTSALAIVPNLHTEGLNTPESLVKDTKQITGAHQTAEQLSGQLAYSGMDTIDGAIYTRDLTFNMGATSATVEGTITGFNMEALKNALDGNAYQAGSSTAWSKNQQFDMAFILVTSGDPPGVAVTTKTVGGALSNITYVLDISNNTVSRMEGTSLVTDANASYGGPAASAGTGKLALPLHNPSNDTIYVAGPASLDREGIEITTAPVDASGNTKIGWEGGIDPADMIVKPDSEGMDGKTYNLSYGAPVAGETTVITVPFYSTAPIEGVKQIPDGTMTITVVVVDGQGFLPKTIEINLKEGYADYTKEFAPGDFTMQYLDSTGAAKSYTIAFYSAATGADAVISGDATAKEKVSEIRGEEKVYYSSLANRVLVVDGGGIRDTTKRIGHVVSAEKKAGVKVLSGLTPGMYNVTMTLQNLEVITGTADTGDANTKFARVQLKKNLPIPIIINVEAGDIPDPEYTYTYELNYDLNGGTGTITNNPDTHSTTATTATTDSHTFTLPANPTKDNHTFAGWKVDDTETVLATTATTYTMTGIQNGKATATLTAQWTENDKYTVSFAHSSAGHPTTLTTNLPTSTTPTSAWPGGSVSWTANPAATGWTFLGWSTASNATVAGFGDATTKSYTLPANTAADVTLYAVWSQNKHDVEYKWATADGQLKGQPKTTGGTAITLPTQADVAEGATFEVSNALTAGTTYVDSTDLGWTFNGWKDAAGTLHVPGAADSKTITMGTEKITLTADWTVKNYTVTYTKGADGSSPAAATIANSSKQVQHGAKHTVGTDGGTGVTGVTAGWLFNGWNRTGELTITADTTITANWKVTVTFNAHGGSAVDSVDVAYNTPVSQPTCTWAGHGLDGWYKEAAYTNKWNFSSNVTGPMTLHAKWTANPQTITWDMNYTGGTDIEWNRSNGDNFFNTTDQTAAPTPTRDGYDFLGWFEATTGGTAITTFPTTVTDDLVYYAHWELKTYTITYNANGHGTAPGDGTKTHGVAYTIVDIAAGADGWRFDGWNTAANGTGTDYDVGDSYTTNAALDLYAKWTANTVTVQARKDTAATAYMNGEAVALHPATGSDITGTLDSSGNYAFSAVKNGTYNVLIDGKQAKTSAGADLTVTVNDNAQTVSAWWYTAEAKTGGNGTVTVAGGGETDTTAATANATASIVVPAGTSVTWTAAPSTNYVFVKWTENNATTTTTTVNKLAAATTRTGTFAQGTFDATVSVTWDGAAPSGSLTSNVTVNGTTKTVKAGTNSVSFTGLTQGTSYAITVDGHATGVSLDKDNTSKTVTYISAIAVTGGNGTATVTGKDAGNVTFGTATTANANAGTSATLWVLPGATVSWTDTANTYYQHKQWEDKATGGSVTTNVTNQTVNASTTRKAIFEQKTADVTVTVKLDGEAKGVGKAVKVTVNSDEKTVAANANAAQAVLTFNVPEQAAGYDVTVTGAPSGWTTTKVFAPSGEDRAKNADVNFYTLTVTEGSNGAAGVAAGTTAPGSATNKSVVLLAGEKATVKAFPDTKYAWSSWTRPTGTLMTAPSAAEAQVTMVAETTTLQANFNKVNYNATLHVTLNGADATVGTDITGVTCNGGTVTGPVNGVWTATGLSTGTRYTWTVATRSGDYTIQTAGTGDTDPDVQSLSLYSVETVKHTTGDNNAATMKTNGMLTGATRVIVKLDQGIDLTLDKKAGYTQVDPYWTEGNASKGTIATAKYKLTTAVDGDGQTLTPVYTYAVTVKTVYGSDPLTVSSIVLKDPATSGAESDKTATNVSSHAFTGLTVSKTYDVWVNGFKAGTTTVNETSIADGVTVTMHKISAVADPAAAAGTGFPKVNDASEIYVPEGTKITTSAPLVTATHGDAQDKYRWLTESDETLWEIKNGNGNDVARIDKDTGAITTIDTKTVNKDIVATVHGVKRVTIKTVDDPTAGGTTIVAEVQKDPPDKIDSDKKGATLDEGHWAKITATANVGYTMTHWDVPVAEVEVYDTLTAGVLSDKLTAATGTTHYISDDGDIWVKVKKDVTATATWEAATYDVEIKVNLDNAAYQDSGSNKVQLMLKDETANRVYNFSDFTQTSAGVYTAKILPGNYDIYVNGLDISKTVTATTAFDTEKNLHFTPYEAEGKKNDGTDMTEEEKAVAQGKLKAEINYYTVKLVADPEGPTVKQNTVKVGASGTAGVTASTIALAKTDAYNITPNVFAAPFTGSAAGETVHYRFVNWTKNYGKLTAKGGSTPGDTAATTEATYQLPAENDLIANTEGNFNITSAAPITLTANFKKQFKVKVALTASTPNTSCAVKIAKAADSIDWSKVSTTEVTVDEGDVVQIYGSTSNAKLVLSDWTIQAGGTIGEFDNTAHANTTAKADKAKGYLFNGSGKFTPKGDTTLELNAWEKPTLAANWTYDIGTGAGTEPTGAAERRATWTVTAGTDVNVTSVHIVNKPSATAVDKTLNKDAGDYTVSNDGVYYTVSDTYLKGSGLATATNYNLQLNYQLGPENHPNRATAAEESTIRIEANKRTLRRVDIGVSTDTTATTLNEHADAKDQAVYVRHWEKNPATGTPNTDLIASDAADSSKRSMIPADELEFTWYYAATAPAASSATKIYTDAQIKAVTDAATPLDATLAEALSSVAKGTLNVKAATLNGVNATLAKALQGKFVFAKVAVKADSATSQGTVITNSIQVDYDATITLKKDVDKVTDYTHYKVYLVPSTVTTPDFTEANLATQGIKKATHVNGTDGDGVYSTKSSSLTAGVEYYVYVNDVEDAIAANHHYMKADNTTITAANQTKTVQYYSVTLQGVAAADVTHAKDKDTNDVGENFEGKYPTFNAATENNTNIPSGNGVLAGRTVNAKAKPLAAPDDDKGWTQDYELTWKHKAGAATAFTPVNSEKRTNVTAVSTAYQYTTNLDSNVTLCANLKQNTYAITGNILGDGTGGQIVYQGDDRPVLTSGTHKFLATSVGNQGKNGGIVTFEVPRSHLGEGKGAITGAYTLSATAVKTGTTITTIKGYAAPSSTTIPSPANTSVDLTKLLAGTTGQAADGTKLNNRFTIFMSKTSLAIIVHDDTTPTANSQRASDNAKASTGNGDQWRKVFANYSKAKGDKMTYDVTIQNDGNAPLNVTLVLQKIKDGTTTDIYKSGDGNNKLTGDDKDTDADNGVQFTGLAGTFPLDEGEDKTFKVTIPVDLDNDDDVTYRFAFTTADGRDGFTATAAPTGQYDLKLTVDPVTIGRVTTTLDADTHTYTVAKHWLEEDALRNGATEETLNTFYSDEQYSAEDLKTAGKETTMGKLFQEGQMVDGTAVEKADADIYYRWYVADCSDPTHVHLDTDTGKLTIVSGTGHSHTVTEVTDDARDHHRSFTPKPEHYGKSLYLVAVGKNNATYAVMTPDETRFEEKPVPIPFRGDVKIYEDDVLITDQTKLSKYTVELRDAADATKKFAATVQETTDAGKYMHQTDVKLEQGHTYQVWASAMESDGTNLINTRETITVGDTVADVYFYQVKVGPTSVDQNFYETGDPLKIQSLANNDASSFFLKTAPTPKPTAKGNHTGDESVDDKYVIKGTTVTFTYPDWEKDYTLTWGGAASGTAQPGADRTTTVTYSSKKTTGVTTQLKLNLYNVDAYVTGMGYVNFIDMKLQDGETTHTFTSETATGKVLGVATTMSQINASSNVGATFRLPKSAAGYTTTADVAGMTVAELQGYRTPHNDSTLVGKDSTFTVPVTAATSFDVVLQGQGQQLTIRDNVPTNLGGEYTDIPESAAGDIASITPVDGADGTPSAAGNAKQTIRLNYNYTTAKTVTVTASNTSKQDESAAEVVLYNVKFTPGVGNSAEITKATGGDFDTDAVKHNLGKTGTKSLTLNIPTGLGVGTYTYSGAFTFTEKADDSGTPVTATVNYTLEVIVQPLEFTGVSVDKKAGATDGTLTIKDYTVTRKAEAGDDESTVRTKTTAPNDTATDPDGVAPNDTGLKQNPDYGYQWISTDADVTAPNIASVSKDGTLTATGGTPNYELLGTNRDYKPTPDDEGRNLYLVIYGKDDASATDNANHRNATAFAVSTAKVNPYSGIVYINVDGTRVETSTGNTNPGYTVEFYSDDETPVKIESTWKEVETGKYGYVSNEGLTPGKEYTVKVSRAKDDNFTVAQTKKLTGEKIGKTLAVTDDTDNFTNVTQVDYYTVNAKPFTQAEFKKDVGEDFTGFDSAPVFTLGGNELADKTPVLKGQDVGVKASATWTQDYKLLWQMNHDGAAFDANWSESILNKQISAVATAPGAYTVSNISDKTYVGGRLDQNVYTVVGTVRNPDGLTGGSVGSVKLAFKPAEESDTRKFTFTSYTATQPADDETNKVYATGAMTDTAPTANNGTYGEPGDTITFKVVKGEYTITATEGAQTTMQYVTIGGTGDPKVPTESDPDLTDRYTKVLTPAVDGADRIFSVYVAQRKLNLGLHGVMPDGAGFETMTVLDVEGSVVGDVGASKKEYEFYYNGTATGTDDVPLTLTNPEANGTGDLNVVATVFRFNSMDDVPTDFTDDTKWTGGSTGATYTDTQDGIKVMEITGLPTAGNPQFVPVGAGDVGGSAAKPGGKLSIDQTSTTKADAVYVIRYTSTRANSTDTGPTPTVFYILDLTVKPLPIVEVANPTKNATGAFEISETTHLHDVTVSTNKEGTATAKADERGLLETDDVIYVWATAPRTAVTARSRAARATASAVTKASFTLADGADIAVSATGTAAGVKLVTSASATTTSYTPTDADQGKDVYLLAVRSKADGSNAVDFAISEAMYAEVTVDVKAYRTNTKNAVPGVDIDATTIPDGTTETGTDTNVFTVTKPDSVITFTADMNDYTPPKPGDPDDPSQATYYFVEWGVDPADAATVPTERSLTWDYPVAKKSTVIGYYDLLPDTNGSSHGYNTDVKAYSNGTDADAEKAARTLVYHHNDGSGRADIYLEWDVTNETTGETTTQSEKLTALNFEETPATFGADGNYILDKTYVKGLTVRSYRIVFYDLEKGTKADGYAGYDRAVPYTISEGEKNVNAVVKDIRAEGAANAEYGGEVKITNDAKPTPGDTGFGLDVTLETNNVAVTLYAKPDDGYVFVEWTKEEGAQGAFANAKKETTLYSGVRNLTEKVIATFEKGKVDMDELEASVIYGTTDFEGDDPVQMTATSTASKTPGNDAFEESFKYTWVTAEELAAAGITDDDFTGKPDWLTIDEDTGALSVTGKVTTNVKSSDPNTYTAVTNEVVAYVKATAQSGDKTESVIKKLTIDVKRADLVIDTPITADDYVTAYLAGEGKDAIEHGDPVKLDYFTYTDVHNKDNAADIVDSEDNAGNGTTESPITHANGVWSVKEDTFDGTGSDPAEETNDHTYTFTFRYKPDSTEEKWNYNSVSEPLTIAAKKPPQTIQFADAISDADDVIPGNWTNGEDSDYSKVGKPEGYDGTYTTAPEEMAYTNATFRKNETITYLDKEPKYQVKFQAIGTIYGATWTVDDLEGFKVAEGTAMPTYADTTIADVTATPFTLELAPKSKDIPTGYEGDLWAGEHHAKFTVSGFIDANKTIAITPATYELTVKVLPKKISAADVSGIDEPQRGETPDTTPTVKAWDDNGDPIEDPTTKEDLHGNIPIDPEVKWTKDDEPVGPEDEFKAGEEYTVTVTLTPDPNYEFEPKTDPDDPTTPTNDPNYTMEEKGDESWPEDKGDPNLTVDLEEDGTVVYEKPWTLPKLPAYPILKHDDVKVDAESNTTGPEVDDARTAPSVVEGTDAATLGSYTVHLGVYNGEAEDANEGDLIEQLSTVYGVVWSITNPELLDKGAKLTYNGADWTKDATQNAGDLTVDGEKATVTLDLSGLDTTAKGTYTLVLKGVGKDRQGEGAKDVESTYTFKITVAAKPSPGGGGGAPEPCPCKVLYHIGLHGTTTDATIEDVRENSRPVKVPKVTALEGYVFRGWSQSDPAALKKGEKPVLVDPKTVDVKGESVIFYAVIEERPFHEHYVIGYPNGNFGPADDIDRASVATIIARAILPNFKEGANYGNPGKYTDVSGHWAESAIAYCSKYGVFEGYTDGTFKPNQPITRQEFALVIARLDGVMTPGEMDFTDVDEAGPWALGGIYTAYEKGWVNGYPDGTFKPLSNIRRDEAVKIFNAYLNRGVDADGLRKLNEYVHSGAASNVTGNGTDEYMTWPDVPQGHWAYYEIVEAANDHEYEPDFESELGYTLPETWDKCWIDERWRYHDDLSGGANAALISAGFRVWLH